MQKETRQKIIDIPSIREMPSEKFYTEAVFQQINGLAVELANTGEIDESRKLTSVLSEKLKKTVGSGINPNLLERYTETLGIARASSERFASNGLGYLKNSILLLIKNKVDPVAFFEPVLTLSDILEGNRQRQALEIFEQNMEEVGEPILISGQETKGRVRPSVSNWLLDFRNFIGLGKPAPTIGSNIVSYIQNSKNYNQLGESQKAEIKEVFRFYNWLLTPTPLPLSLQTETDDVTLTTAPVSTPITASKESQISQETTPVQKQVQLKEKILQLSQKHNLRVDESGALEKEIVSVLEGNTHPNEFVERLRLAMPLAEEQTLRDLVADVNETIFEPVRKAVIEKKTPEESSVEEESLGAIKQKFEGSVYTPSETKDVDEKQDAGYTSTDPYREPIE